MKIYPSLLSADSGQLNSEIASVEQFADGLHYDVMDGHFVPSITMGAPILHRLETSLPIDVHLMVDNPNKIIPQFLFDSVESISFHIEASEGIQADLKLIKNAGKKAGLAINPETEISELDPYLDQLDYVLVMSVHPGEGGQEFLPIALEKIRYLKSRKPDLIVAVDGGINQQTASSVSDAGADILVAGNYIFRAGDRAQAIQNLQSQ